MAQQSSAPMQPLDPGQEQPFLLPLLLGVFMQLLLLGVMFALAIKNLAQPSTRSKHVVTVAVLALGLAQTITDATRCGQIFATHFGDWAFVMAPRVSDGLGSAFGAVQQGIGMFTLLYQIYRLAPVSIGIGGGAELELVRSGWKSVWRSSWVRKGFALIMGVAILLSCSASFAAAYFQAARKTSLLNTPAVGLPGAWVICTRIWMDTALWIDVMLVAVLTLELVRARMKVAACARQTHLSSRSRGDPRSAELPPIPAPTARSPLSFLLRLIPLSGSCVLAMQFTTLVLIILDLRRYKLQAVAWSSFCVIILPNVYGVTTLLVVGYSRQAGLGGSWPEFMPVDTHDGGKRGRTVEKPPGTSTATTRRPLVQTNSAATVTAQPTSRSASRTSLFQYAPPEAAHVHTHSHKKGASFSYDPPPTGSTISGGGHHPFSTAASPCPDSVPGFAVSAPSGSAHSASAHSASNPSPIPSSISGSSSHSPARRQSSSSSSEADTSAGGSTSSVGLGFWGVQLPANAPPPFFGVGGRVPVRDAADMASLSTITEETRSAFTTSGRDSLGRRTTGVSSPLKGSSGSDRPNTGETRLTTDEEAALRAAKRATQSSFLQMSSSDSRTISRKSSNNPFLKMSSSSSSPYAPDRDNRQSSTVFVPPYSFIDIAEGHPLSPGEEEAPVSLDRPADAVEGEAASRGPDGSFEDLQGPPIMPPRVLSLALGEPSTSRSRMSPVPPAPPSPSTSSSSGASSQPRVSRGLTARALSAIPSAEPVFRLGLSQRQAAGPAHKESYLSMRTTSSDGRSPRVDFEEEALPYATVWTVKDKSASLVGAEEEAERVSVRTGVSGRTGSTWGCKDRNGNTDSEPEAGPSNSRQS